MPSVIYNCKRCKTRKRVEYPHHANSGSLYRLSYQGQRITAGIWIVTSGWTPRPTSHGFLISRQVADATFFVECDGDPLGLCDTCQRAMDYGTLRAVGNPAVRCDARCTNARGHSCECACAGEHHGSGWSSTPRFSALINAMPTESTDDEFSASALAELQREDAEWMASERAYARESWA